MDKLDYIEINPKTEAQFSVIWLHGLGADGHDFEPVVPQLQLPEAKAVRFVFPHAPLRSITINNNMSMRAWYDIVALSLNAAEDETGIRQSAQLIEELITNEQSRGIDASRIILAGFSQGGAMALHTGLRFPQTLAGIVGLSCYLPLFQHLEQEAHPSNLSTPIFMAHGEYDPVVPMTLGEMTHKFLVQQGYSVQWETYPMEHHVCAEEITSLGRWLQGMLNAIKV